MSLPYKQILETTEGTASKGRFYESFTLETLTKLINEQVAEEEAPFRKLLSDNGFDPDVDYLYISKEYAEEHDITIPKSLRGRVLISSLTHQGIPMLALRNNPLQRGFINDTDR